MATTSINVPLAQAVITIPQGGASTVTSYVVPSGKLFIGVGRPNTSQGALLLDGVLVSPYGPSTVLDKLSANAGQTYTVTVGGTNAGMIALDGLLVDV